MNERPPALALSLSALLCAAVGAQGSRSSDAAAALPAGVVPIHSQAAAPGGGSYGTWAAGRDYKVSFGDGVAFVPYLGDAAPQNRPLRWRTESVRVGSEDLVGAAAPERWHDAERFEYRYGKVTEAYDVLEPGVEQTFVIAERPAAAGDLVVTGVVTTPLSAAERAAVHGAIDFADGAGRVVVRYGAAWAIDAAGRRLAIAASYRSGRIALRVPAEWLADAAYPVVVDPLLAPHFIGASAPAHSVDVVRNDFGDDFMVVFARGASAADHDAFVYLMNDDYTGRKIVFSDITSSWSTPRIRCAVTGGSLSITGGGPAKYCAAFDRVLGNGTGQVAFHLHDDGDFNLRTSTTTLPAGSNDHYWRVDVGGAFATGALAVADDDFCIVWQMDRGATLANTTTSLVIAAIVGLDGRIGRQFLVRGNGRDDYERPSINQAEYGTSRTPAVWRLAFQRHDNGGSASRWEWGVTTVSAAGAVAASLLQPDPAHDQLAPQIAGAAGRYLVAYAAYAGTRWKPGGSSGHALEVRRFDWPNGGGVTIRPSEVVYGPFTGPQLELGGVAYDFDTDSHWAITSARLRSQGGDGNAMVDRVGYHGQVTEGGLILEAAGASEQGEPGGVTYDCDADDFVAAWSMNTSTGGGARITRFAYRTPIPPAVGGTSCSTATLDWVGSTQIGSQFPSARLRSAPSGVPAVLLVSLSPVDIDLSPLGLTGCRLLVDNGSRLVGALSTATDASGTALLNLRLPEWLNRDLIYFQWLHVQAGANPLHAVTTRRLQIEIIK